ncbi:MAG: response regulator, partial [Anaerolineales bacterium]|nr:response regulator [Anaerolineales bacterium]
MTRDLLRMMLTPSGFEIHEAEDGLDALEKIGSFMPDIVLLDVMMPNM